MMKGFIFQNVLETQKQANMRGKNDEVDNKEDYHQRGASLDLVQGCMLWTT